MQNGDYGIVGIVALTYALIVAPIIYFKFYRKRKKGVEFKGIEAVKFFALFSVLPSIFIIVLGILITDVRDISGILLLIFLPLSSCITSAAFFYGIAYFLTKYVTKKPMKF